jgi:hypothetical protein
MGKGYSKPKHFSDEEDAEYRMTEEYKEEVCGFDYSHCERDEEW